MNALDPSETFVFEDFRLDGRGLFRRNHTGAFVPVKIGSRALDLLRTLVERAGGLVTKNELTAAAWPGTSVDESNLAVQVSALRGILDNPEAGTSCIQTAAGRGYRFVAPVIRRLEETRLSATVFPETGTRPAPRLSIVVLPFASLGDDPEQHYFADAITDDLTTDLSRLPDMVVISRGTAFTYQHQPTSARQIGRELNVRYVLEGSVRRAGDQVRVNAQLIEAEFDAHLWAERFDAVTSDLSTLQDEITRQIAIALNLELVAVEATRSTAHPDALDYILRARAVMIRARTPETWAQAVSLYEHALALDPHSVEAQIRLASQLVGRVLDDMSESPTADIERAEDLIAQVLRESPRGALTHFVKGQLLRLERRYEDAIPEYEAVLALDRNQVPALVHLSICKFMTGLEEKTIPLIQEAIRLSPRDPMIANWYYRIGLVHLYRRRTAEAIHWLRKACRTNPKYVLAVWTLASAYGIAGDGRAAPALAEARKLDAQQRYATLELVRSNWVAIRPDTRFETIFLAGLRNAGLPEK
jgi:adenylate cyclase